MGVCDFRSVRLCAADHAEVMKNLTRSVLHATLLVAANISGAAAGDRAATFTGLDKYFQAPVSNYRYEVPKTIPGEGHTAYLGDMTSQVAQHPNRLLGPPSRSSGGDLRLGFRPCPTRLDQ